MKSQLIVLLAVIAISRASPQNAAELSESEGDAVVSINIIIKCILISKVFLFRIDFCKRRKTIIHLGYRMQSETIPSKNLDASYIEKSMIYLNEFKKGKPSIALHRKKNLFCFLL